jgi:hypothetical protein
MERVSEIRIKYNPFVKTLGVLCVLVVRLFFYLLKDASAFFLGFTIVGAVFVSWQLRRKYLYSVELE